MAFEDPFECALEDKEVDIKQVWRTPYPLAYASLTQEH